MSPVQNEPTAREALLYEHRPDGSVVCNLCAHRCIIRPGLRGICGVRENRGGTLVSLVADRIVSGGVDPIEKKPLFHFLPGSLAFSIATAGCNFHCLFCQNWTTAQAPRMHPGRIPGEAAAAEDIVRAARRAGCASIAYTYTEPTIFMELAIETGRLAVEAGLRNIFVTNGYMTPEALALVAPVLHGANVDLKSFSDRYYRKVCGATLPPVLKTIAGMRGRGIWVEVTTLLIPGHNDTDQELKAMAAWLAGVDREMPWHVSAFFPTYKMTDVPPTPATALHGAAQIGRDAGLRYVYTGNVPGDVWENTPCPGCSKCVIRRCGFEVLQNRVSDGRCPDCATPIAGVWR